MDSLTPEQRDKQLAYRHARSSGQYDAIWQSVDKCVFCDLNEKYVFFEENGIVMTISLYAYIDGHFMIVPRRHVDSARQLTGLEWETIRKFLYIAKKIVKDVTGAKGMQLVQKDGSAAQSTVGHVHFHCIPFDTPDLCTWNYRRLQYTPLENVEKYKADGKKLLSYGKRYTQKYANRSSLPVICDLVIINDKQQVLLQERTRAARLIPDYLTLPGGGVDDFTVPLEHELVREVSEECGLTLRPDDVSLIDSRLGSIDRHAESVQLGLAYRHTEQFIWNTYCLRYDLPADTKVTVGDDCREIIWIALADVAGHPRISPQLNQAIHKAALRRDSKN